MLILITLLIIAVISTIGMAFLRNNYKYQFLCGINFPVCIIAFILLFYFGVVALVEQKVGRENCLSYYVDKALYESACNNPNLTAEERSQVITMVIKNNKYINNTKLWKNNKWLNWFQYAPVGDLPLFDLTKIQYVNSKNTGDYNVKKVTCNLKFIDYGIECTR